MCYITSACQLQEAFHRNMKLGFGFILFLFLASTKACDEADCRTGVAVGK
jgi:hypothetical protein